jgi:hypothetical protein
MILQNMGASDILAELVKSYDLESWQDLQEYFARAGGLNQET